MKRILEEERENIESEVREKILVKEKENIVVVERAHWLSRFKQLEVKINTTCNVGVSNN